MKQKKANRILLDSMAFNTHFAISLMTILPVLAS